VFLADWNFEPSASAASAPTFMGANHSLQRVIETGVADGNT
jgi:hypothetical protein